MAKTLLLEIVTPERQVLRQDVSSVTAPGVAGEFTILPQHIPFLTALRIGSLSYRVEGRVDYVFVSGGFVEVLPHRVLLLAEVAERPEEIDIDRARQARERAALRLARAKQEAVDYARALSALERAVTRIKLHQLALGGIRTSGNQ